MNRMREKMIEFFGVDRNLSTEEKESKGTNWDNEKICLNFLVLEFCPYKLFKPFQIKQKKCNLYHDKNLSKEFNNLPYELKRQKQGIVLFRVNNIVKLIDEKISFSISNLNSSRKEAKKMSTNDIIGKINQKISELKNKLKKAYVYDDNLGFILELTQNINKLAELKEESILQSNSNHNINKNIFTTSKALKILESVEKITGLSENDKEENNLLKVSSAKICRICGAYILENDIQQRAITHLTGSYHIACALVRKAKEKLEKEGVEEVIERNFERNRNMNKRNPNYNNQYKNRHINYNNKVKLRGQKYYRESFRRPYNNN